MHFPQLIERAWIYGDVPILELNPMFRKKLFR